jgi:uncharacterized membrane protein
VNGRGLQFLSFLCAGSIVGLTGLRQLFIDPLEDPTDNLIWFAIQVLPIALVVPGMLRHGPRSYLFAALAAMLYFCHGVLLVVTPEQRMLGLFEVGFSVALVVTATLALRGLNRNQ